MMEGLERLLAEHPLIAGLPTAKVARLAGCVANHRFEPGEFLMREGERHGHIFLIRSGTVAIEAAAPGGEPTTIETVGPGEVLGISWLTPARGHFDCRARDRVLAFSIDQDCLRAKMESDTDLGYSLASRLLDITYARLARLRLQRLDVYR
jgi:CRP/FNR family transcriptional regulator, cyclic AMP receptor protein